MGKPSHRKYLKSPSMKVETFKALIGFILILIFISVISSFFVNDGNNNNSNTGGDGEDYNPNLIIFTVGQSTLQAERGMTWSEWINSTYNPGYFSLSDNYICLGSHLEYAVFTSDGTVVLKNYVIVGGTIYLTFLTPDPDPVVHDYYLVGFINGADYGCADDYATIGDYKFVDGKLVVTFEADDNYVFVKTGNNANWYMASAYCTDTTVTLANTTTGTFEKLYVPGGVEITFTLVANEDDTLILSYTSPHDHSYIYNVIINPTCESIGLGGFTCSCGDFFTETIEALGHKAAEDDGDVTTPVNCANEGCNKILVPAKEVLTISAFENGIVTADKDSYKVGDTVTLTIAPAKNYAQKLYINGAPILVDANSKYSFVVEAGKTYEITGEFVNVQGAWFWTAEYIVLNQAHGVFHSPVPTGGEKNGELVPTADNYCGGKVLFKDPSGGTKQDLAIVLKMTFSDGQKAEIRLVNKDGKGHYMVQSMSGMFGSWKWYYDLNDEENAAVANGEGVWFGLIRYRTDIELSLNGKILPHRADTPISLAENTVLNQFKVTTYNYSYAIDVQYEFYKNGSAPDPDTGGDGEDYNPNLITFTVGQSTLQAERGMTWSEWINSTYNPGYFSLSDNYICLGSHLEYAVFTSDGTVVLKNDVIVGGTIYLTFLTPDPDTGEDDNPNLITFTVGDDTLQAESGMTWLDWLVTSYNTTYFSIERNYIGYYDRHNYLLKFLFNPSGNVVSVFDTIIENAVYTFLDQSNVDLSSPGGGSYTKSYISFKVGSGTLIAEEGMTWEEWLSDSRYNISGFATDGNYVFESDLCEFYLSDYYEMAISVTDKIIHNSAYQFLTDPYFVPDVINPNLITFIIEGTTLQAESGMTWGEWINSGYNPGVFVLNHGLVCLGAGLEYAVFTPDGIGVEENDVIVSDVIYKTYSISGLFPTPDPDPDTGEDDNPVLITFTVGRTNLLAESGMTWSQWLTDPDYNTADFVQYGEYICVGTTDYYLCTEDGTRVKPSDMILEGGVYNFSNV